MRVHAFQTATLVGNETFFRSDGFGSLLRRRRDVEFPVLSFVIEHPDGLIAIDTGFGAVPRVPRTQRRVVPVPKLETAREMAALMRERGLDPQDVRTVLLTHLDWDHAGGLAQFPRAQVLVHRPELDFARTRMGRMRYQPQLWPAGFSPRPFDLEPEPLGEFPESLEVATGVHALPLPGHSIGQVGVLAGDRLFCADHIMSEAWFREDVARGRELGTGKFYAKPARETTRRLLAFDGVLVPSHDPQSPARLATAELPGRFGGGAAHPSSPVPLTPTSP